MHYSFAMWFDCNLVEDQSFFKASYDGQNFRVSFEADKDSQWEAYVKQHLKKGCWNEYLLEDRVVFLFNLENEFRRYEVFFYQNDEVLNLCRQLSGVNFPSILEMLLGNPYYQEFIK